jgi:formamidopyrimidine-DNA glycosylase
MPELPEVETTCRGIAPHLIGKQISRFVVNNASLRWPVPKHLKKTLAEQTVCNVTRAPNTCWLR